MPPIFIARRKLNIAKYTACLHASAQVRVYAEAWYLDTIAGVNGWGALVLNDYEAVMPLPYNHKLFGMAQIYQPYLCQQLGVFSRQPMDSELVIAFLAAIPKRFLRVHTHLNDANSIGILPPPKRFLIKPAVNLTLRLQQPYEVLYQKFSDNAKRNIRKAAPHHLQWSEDCLTPETLLTLFRENMGQKLGHLPSKFYTNALQIMRESVARQHGKLIAATTSEGTLLAVAFVLIAHRRLIFLLNTTTPEGKERAAMFWLLHELIRRNANNPDLELLDFEGSSIDSVARFYQSFGATNQPYSLIGN